MLASRSVLDKRFQGLSTALSDAKLTVGNGRIDKSELAKNKYINRPRQSQFLPASTSSGLFNKGSNQLANFSLTRAATTFR